MQIQKTKPHCKGAFSCHSLNPGISFISLAFALALAILLTRPAATAQVLTLSPVITTGLNQPIQLVNAADDTHRLFIVQKEGSILVYDSSYNFLSVFLTIPGISTTESQGLLSMAFHPDYENNGGPSTHKIVVL